MTWIVRICDCAEIFSDFGVAVNAQFLDLPEHERERILRRGLSTLERASSLDVEYAPLEWWRTAGLGIDGFEQALDELERQRQQDAAKRKAKRVHTARRRAEFNAMRSDLVLQMLDAGVDYVCAVGGCGACEDLTVDHVRPLSRGGTDDLSNLQFMCRVHNSAKGDRQ